MNSIQVDTKNDVGIIMTDDHQNVAMRYSSIFSCEIRKREVLSMDYIHVSFVDASLTC